MSESLPHRGPAPSDGRRLADLTTLLDISRQLGASVELDTILGLIASSALKVLDCERSSILLFDQENNEFYSRVATGTSGARELRFPADRGIAGEALRSGKVVNVPDAYADPRFNPDVDRQTGFRTRNLLTCPLLGLEGPVGVLQVLNNHRGSFSNWEEELIVTFAAQAGVALQRQLLLDSMMEKKRLQSELATARSIQQQLLPAFPPQLDGFEIAGWNRPADQTGGDFYDLVKLDEDRVAVALADVTGHGIGPALLAAESRALFRACVAGSPRLEDVVARVNDLLAADIPADRFVTAFIGVVDRRTSTCQYVSAGQGPLLLYRRGTDEVIELPTNGLPLGVFAPADFTEPNTITLSSGDLLLLATDGFIEWPNAAGECYGLERLSELIRRTHGESPGELIKELYDAVRAFGNGVEQQDDLTGVVVRKV